MRFSHRARTHSLYTELLWQEFKPFLPWVLTVVMFCGWLYCMFAMIEARGEANYYRLALKTTMYNLYGGE